MSWFDPPPLVDKPLPEQRPLPWLKRSWLILFFGAVFWILPAEVAWWAAVALLPFVHVSVGGTAAWIIAACVLLAAGAFGLARTLRILVALQRLAERQGWSAERPDDTMAP